MSLTNPHGETDSNRFRVVTFFTGLEMVKAHPWFGLGPEEIRRNFGPAFDRFEQAATAFFAVEYVCRVWASVDFHNQNYRDPLWGRLRYMRSFFAVIDLVAAVGLWLAAAWGAVVWLSSVVSMAVVEIFFPNVFGGSIFIALIEMTLLGVYLWLAIVSAREHPA